MRINLFGGPSVGKSTLAAKVFSTLKQEGHNVELVSEYVKSWAWEKRVPTGYDQMYIFAKQLRSEELLLRQGVHIVTDSPLPLQLAYADKYNCVFYDELVSLCKKFGQRYPSLNVVLTRTVPFQQHGRFETAQEAFAIDQAIVGVLERHKIEHCFRDPMTEGVQIVNMARSLIEAEA